MVDANMSRGDELDLSGPFELESMAGSGAALRERVRALGDRLRATTPRERILLAVLMLGALIYAPIMAGDFRASQEDRYVQALGDRASATLVQQAARRIAAATENRTALEDMRSWGFQAANVPVAQVMIEQRLVQAATAAEMVNSRITVRDQIETVGATQWLEAEVQADLRWNPTFAMLDDVAAWPEGFRVTRFQYEMTAQPVLSEFESVAAPSGRVVIGLAFPVSIDETAEGPA